MVLLTISFTDQGADALSDIEEGMVKSYEEGSRRQQARTEMLRATSTVDVKITQ